MYACCWRRAETMVWDGSARTYVTLLCGHGCQQHGEHLGRPWGTPAWVEERRCQVQEVFLEEAVSDPMKGCPEWHMEEGQQEYKVTLYNHGKVGLPAWPGASRVDT